MDKFCEQLVKRQIKPIQKVVKCIIVINAIFLSIYAFLYLFSINSIISFIVMIGIIFAAVWYVTNSNFEFEYIITNGSLDIDKIIAKKKRKRLVTVDVRNLTLFEKLTDIQHLNDKDKINKIIAHDGISENIYIAEFNSHKGEKTRLYFSPDEKTIKNLNPFIPRSIRK